MTSRVSWVSWVSGQLALPTTPVPALTALGFAVHWTGYWSDVLSWNLALVAVLTAAAMTAPVRSQP